MVNEYKVGIIGGSGFYSFFESTNLETIEIDTPFGKTSVAQGFFHKKPIVFISRHGPGHSVPPHKINHKANIYALFKLGISHILSTNAVGSIKTSMKPGEFVVLDQFIDLVSGPITFFEGNFEVEINHHIRKGVVHLDMTQPYSQYLREKIIQAFEFFPDEINHPKGCYVMNTGPRFETPSEIRMFQILESDVVGMTNAPECILARELSMEYATICLITNYAAGLQKEITHQEVIDLFKLKIHTLTRIIQQVVDLIN